MRREGEEEEDGAKTGTRGTMGTGTGLKLQGRFPRNGKDVASVQFLDSLLLFTFCCREGWSFFFLSLSFFFFF